MTTHIVILAQGRQERLASVLTTPKQLVPLPACNNTPILQRTLLQLNMSCAPATTRVTVVGWHEVTKELRHGMLDVEATSLADPGNSSLKGIHRYLETHELTAGAARADRMVVLLGDVVYSWLCLEAIFAGFATDTPKCRFVGSDNISPAGGELWGLAWQRSDKPTQVAMMAGLERAIAKHPPYESYQPGQMRRWMWQIHPAFQTTAKYRRVDDYTHDIDTPKDLSLVQGLSEKAAADDAVHGVTW